MRLLTILVSCKIVAQAQESGQMASGKDYRIPKGEPALSEEDFVEESFDGEHREHEFTAQQLEQLHGHADEDKNGKLSLAEAVAHVKRVEVAQAFADVDQSREELDKDGDQLVTLEEYLVEVQAEAAHMSEDQAKKFAEVERAKFAVADANGDGVLHTDEIPSVLYPHIHAEVLNIEVKESMRQRDKSGDEKLTINEFFRLSPEDEPEIWLTERRRTEFAKLDEDDDGLINLEEFGHYLSGTFHAYEAIRHLFGLADRDGDLQLTSAELAAAKDKISSSEARHHLKEWVDHHEL